MYVAIAKIITTTILLSYCQNAFSQTQCLENLPPFGDQGKHSPTLPVGIQALVPAYHFSCAGAVVRWAVATERRGRHRIDLQVWRRTNQTDATYTMVGANTFTTQPNKKQKILHLTPNVSDQIQVLPADVIGFYLEDNTLVSDDFQIQYKPNSTNTEVQYITTMQPHSIIYPDTLAVSLQSMAPVILVELEQQEFTINDTVLENNTINDTVLENNTSHSVAITSALIGILLFGIMLAVFIVLVALVKSRSTGRAHVSQRQRSSSTMHLTSTTNSIHGYMGVKQVSTGTPKDVTLHANPAYGHVSSTAPACDYETPVLLTQNLTVSYETPQALKFMESHDYEDPA